MILPNFWVQNVLTLIQTFEKVSHSASKLNTAGSRPALQDCHSGAKQVLFLS